MYVTLLKSHCEFMYHKPANDKLFQFSLHIHHFSLLFLNIFFSIKIICDFYDASFCPYVGDFSIKQKWGQWIFFLKQYWIKLLSFFICNNKLRYFPQYECFLLLFFSFEYFKSTIKPHATCDIYFLFEKSHFMTTIVRLCSSNSITWMWLHLTGKKEKNLWKERKKVFK